MNPGSHPPMDYLPRLGVSLNPPRGLGGPWFNFLHQVLGRLQPFRLIGYILSFFNQSIYNWGWFCEYWSTQQPSQFFSVCHVFCFWIAIQQWFRISSLSSLNLSQHKMKWVSSSASNVLDSLHFLSLGLRLTYLPTSTSIGKIPRNMQAIVLRKPRGRFRLTRTAISHRSLTFTYVLNFD